MRQRFRAMWEPRLGPRATDLLWQRTMWRATGLPFLVVTLFLAATASSTVYFAVVGLLCSALITGNAVVFWRTRRPLAAAMSDHLSLLIEPNRLPPLRRTELFDKFVGNLRAGRPGNSTARTFLGGRIRIEKP